MKLCVNGSVEGGGVDFGGPIVVIRRGRIYYISFSSSRSTYIKTLGLDIFFKSKYTVNMLIHTHMSSLLYVDYFERRPYYIEIIE